MTKSSLWKPMTQLPGVDRCRNAREPRGRVPQAPRRRGVPGDPAAFGVRAQRVPAEGAHHRRLRRAAGRGPDVPLRGAPRDDDRPHAGRDPRARPQGSEAHPGELPRRGARRPASKARSATCGARLRDDPKLYPFTTGEQVIEHLYRIHARIVPQLPKLFGRMPKAAFEIRLTDPAIAATAPAQYYSPTDDGRPGIFSMPVPNPRQVSTFGLAALLAHEGMPGHHFEIGIKLENKVPEFRRRLGVNAYRRGLGPVRRVARPRARPVRQPARSPRPLLDRAVPRRAPGGGHRAAREGLAARAGDPLSRRGMRQHRRRRDGRSAALHGLARTGALLQDRRARRSSICERRRRSASARASTSAHSTTWCSPRAIFRSRYCGSASRAGSTPSSRSKTMQDSFRQPPNPHRTGPLSCAASPAPLRPVNANVGARLKQNQR